MKFIPHVLVCKLNLACMQILFKNQKKSTFEVQLENVKYQKSFPLSLQIRRGSK